MTKEGLLITLGVLTAVSPFVGLPSSWLAYILPMFGLIAAVVAFFMLRARKAQGAGSVFHEAPPALS